MTVIAYSSKHRIMAADSRCAADEAYHFTSVQKLHCLKSGALLGLAGDMDLRDVVALFERARPRKMPTRAQIAELKADFDGLIVFPNGQLFSVTGGWMETDSTNAEWRGEVLAVRDTFAAIGSGAAYAYGAMESGATPTKAVWAACRRDVMCAAPVKWERLA